MIILYFCMFFPFEIACPRHSRPSHLQRRQLLPLACYCPRCISAMAHIILPLSLATSVPGRVLGHLSISVAQARRLAYRRCSVMFERTNRQHYSSSTLSPHCHAIHSTEFCARTPRDHYNVSLLENPPLGCGPSCVLHSTRFCRMSSSSSLLSRVYDKSIQQTEEATRWPGD